QIQQEQEKILALSDTEKQYEEDRSRLEQSKGAIEQALSDARHAAQASQLQFEQAQSRITHQQRQLSLLEQTIDREKRQLEHVSQQRTRLQEQLSTTDSPLQGFQAELQTLLDQRLVVEKQLQQAENHLQ
ncbi:MAG TPA: hypothetical protein DCL40_05740, partial [Coxiellaceae bacterium]|nr:hypothetical protein [Coxiellaceae bacterium]